MTKAQREVWLEQALAESEREYRAFRKKCVTQGIVTFSRENGSQFITVRYRDRYVATLFKETIDERILLAVWNTIFIAEKTIKKIEGVYL